MPLIPLLFNAADSKQVEQAIRTLDQGLDDMHNRLIGQLLLTLRRALVAETALGVLLAKTGHQISSEELLAALRKRFTGSDPDNEAELEEVALDLSRRLNP